MHWEDTTVTIKCVDGEIKNSKLFPTLCNLYHDSCDLHKVAKISELDLSWVQIKEAQLRAIMSAAKGLSNDMSSFHPYYHHAILAARVIGLNKDGMKILKHYLIDAQLRAIHAKNNSATICSLISPCVKKRVRKGESSTDLIYILDEQLAIIPENKVSDEEYLDNAAEYLYEFYEQWCESNSIPPVTLEEFRKHHRRLTFLCMPNDIVMINGAIRLFCAIHTPYS